MKTKLHLLTFESLTNKKRGMINVQNDQRHLVLETIWEEEKTLILTYTDAKTNTR